MSDATYLHRVERDDGAPLSAEPIPNLLIFASHVDGGEWPKRTNELCAYDLQPFTTQPVGIPRRYDEKTHRYYLQGFFCSWSCAKEFLEREVGQCVTQSDKRKLMIFDHFCASVLNVEARQIASPPPLQRLAQLAAVYSSAERPAERAAREWRSGATLYTDCRPVENLFVPISQVFEHRLLRERSILQQSRAAERLERAEPKALIETREAQRQQSRIIGQRAQAREKKRGAIDDLLGIKRVKK